MSTSLNEFSNYFKIIYVLHEHKLHCTLSNETQEILTVDGNIQIYSKIHRYRKSIFQT